MSASIDDVLRELKAMIIPDAKPLDDEIEAVEEYRKRRDEGKLDLIPFEALECD